MPERADLERRTTELLQRLIRFNTVNPPGNEQAAQEFLQGLLEAAGFECELLAAVEGRPEPGRAPARPAPTGRALCLLGHVDTVLADPAEWTRRPVVGRAARRLRLGPRRARHEEPGGRRGRGGARARRGGLAARGRRAAARVHRRRGDRRRRTAPSGCASEHPDKVRAATWWSTRAPARCSSFDGRRVYGVCVGEKGVFRFTLTTTGRAGHASIPRIGDNALVKLAPVLEALRERPPALRAARPSRRRSCDALGLDAADLDGGARASSRQRDPRMAVLLEPMLGRDAARRRWSRASREDQRDPRRARELKVDCRVPPELGEDHALRADPRGGRRRRLRDRVRRARWSATARRSTRR